MTSHPNDDVINSLGTFQNVGGFLFVYFIKKNICIINKFMLSTNH